MKPFGKYVIYSGYKAFLKSLFHENFGKSEPSIFNCHSSASGYFSSYFAGSIKIRFRSLFVGSPVLWQPRCQFFRWFIDEGSGVAGLCQWF